MTIRLIRPEEKGDAIRLISSVFMEFEAPDYSEEGIRAFLSFLSEPEMLALFTMYGAFEKETLIGVLAVRDRVHISLFFVDGKWHKQGIGTALFHRFLSETDADMITVNAAPFAVPFYRKLGFIAVDTEKTENGIRYRPMQYRKSRK